MKHISILVPQGENNLSSIVGPYKIFTKANEYWQKLGREVPCAIQLVGLSGTVDLYGGLFVVNPQVLAGEVTHTDLVIIPSLHRPFENTLRLNRDYLPWIQRQVQQGAEVASICTGAFLLAATGLLNGRQCSTHWNAASDFRRLFPQTQLVTEKVITDEAGIYTNGGAYSFLHLVLYLVEKYYDRPTAIYCSKIFQVDMDRFSQSPFSIFSGQKEHEDVLVREAQEYMEQHYDERLPIDRLAARLNINRRSFDRRFIQATSNSPLEYLQRLRIEAAKKMLETSQQSVSDVMFAVGYSDVKAFREVFKKITGLSPLDYRARYHKESPVGV